MNLPAKARTIVTANHVHAALLAIDTLMEMVEDRFQPEDLGDVFGLFESCAFDLKREITEKGRQIWQLKEEF